MNKTRYLESSYIELAQTNIDTTRIEVKIQQRLATFAGIIEDGFDILGVRLLRDCPILVAETVKICEAVPKWLSR